MKLKKTHHLNKKNIPHSVKTILSLLEYDSTIKKSQCVTPRAHLIKFSIQIQRLSWASCFRQLNLIYLCRPFPSSQPFFSLFFPRGQTQNFLCQLDHRVNNGEKRRRDLSHCMYAYSCGRMTRVGVSWISFFLQCHRLGFRYCKISSAYLYFPLL